jgi:hypothetical protein
LRRWGGWSQKRGWLPSPGVAVFWFSLSFWPLADAEVPIDSGG